MGKYILLGLLCVAGFFIWRIVELPNALVSKHKGTQPPPESSLHNQPAPVGKFDSRVKAGAPLSTVDLALPVVVVLPLSSITAKAVLGGPEKMIAGASVTAALGGAGVVISGNAEAVKAAALVINGMDSKSVPTVVVAAVVLREEIGGRHKIGLWDVARSIAASSEFGSVSYDWATGVLSFGAITAAQKVIQALGEQSISRSGFSVVDKPHLAMQSGESAVWESGREIPVPVFNQGSVNTTTSIQYKKVLTGLTISATVNAAGRIFLEVLQVDDRIVGTTRIAGADVPTMSNQKLMTKIELSEGDVAILGGSKGTADQKSASGFPLVGQVFPLSLVFGNRAGEKSSLGVSVALTAWILPAGVRPDVVSKAQPAAKRRR
jgi:type II secretory pathway component GspD/PulD (secretin)